MFSVRTELSRFPLPLGPPQGWHRGPASPLLCPPSSQLPLAMAVRGPCLPACPPALYLPIQRAGCEIRNSFLTVLRQTLFPPQMHACRFNFCFPSAFSGCYVVRAGEAFRGRKLQTAEGLLGWPYRRRWVAGVGRPECLLSHPMTLSAPERLLETGACVLPQMLLLQGATSLPCRAPPLPFSVSGTFFPALDPVSARCAASSLGPVEQLDEMASPIPPGLPHPFHPPPSLPLPSSLRRSLSDVGSVSVAHLLFP